MMMLRPVLLKFLTAFCALPGCVTAATAPTAPVVCGSPGGCDVAPCCAEAAGLKPVDELHEVRLHSASTYHVLVYEYTLTVPRRCARDHVGEVLLRLPRQTFERLVQKRKLLGMGKLPS